MLPGSNFHFLLYFTPLLFNEVLIINDPFCLGWKREMGLSGRMCDKFKIQNS